MLAGEEMLKSVLNISFAAFVFILLFFVLVHKHTQRRLYETNGNINTKVGFHMKRPNLAPVITFDASLCKRKALWGKEHQGGWMICLDSIKPNNCVVYSFGLGADWSFDSAAEEYGCEVHGFDPTGSLWRNKMHGAEYSNINYQVQYPSEKKFFHNWGVGPADYAVYPSGSIPQEWPGLGDPALSKSNIEPWEMKSIKRTFIDLKHTAGIQVLKIDVEGAEWDSIAALLSDLGDNYDTTSSSKEKMKLLSQGSIRQLLVEWHWDPDSRYHKGGVLVYNM